MTAHLCCSFPRGGVVAPPGSCRRRGEGRSQVSSEPGSGPLGGPPSPTFRLEGPLRCAHCLPGEPACPGSNNLGAWPRLPGGRREGTAAIAPRMRCQVALECRNSPTRIYWEKFIDKEKKKISTMKCPEPQAVLTPRAVLPSPGRQAECRACSLPSACTHSSGIWGRLVRFSPSGKREGRKGAGARDTGSWVDG